MTFAIDFIRSSVEEMGATCLFFAEVLRSFRRSAFSFSVLVNQIYLVGVRSLVTTLVAGVFVGGIMAIQINLQLKDFGAQGFLGGLSTSTTVRDVGPVLIGFILSGKVGAYTSAELGTMRVTHQVDAIRCLGVNPLQYLILPRLVAVVFSSFLLLIVGLMMTVVGGMFLSSVHLGVNFINYVTNISRLVSWGSVGMGVFKSFVFGVLIGGICCYQGYHVQGGSEGVGRAVKRASVEILVSIIVANYVVSAFVDAISNFLGTGS
jgi:phospholipid/cholesterol/gamma-HCH transport system permease protein